MSNHNISLDKDLSEIVKEKTETEGLCLSRIVAAMLRERYKEDLKKKQK